MPSEKNTDKSQSGQKPASTNDAGLKTRDLEGGNEPQVDALPGDIDKDAAKGVDHPSDAKTRDLLARAGSSSDAAVQNLLAQRRIHEANADAAAVADIDRQLSEALPE